MVGETIVPTSMNCMLKNWQKKDEVNNGHEVIPMNIPILLPQLKHGTAKVLGYATQNYWVMIVLQNIKRQIGKHDYNHNQS